jgi:AAA domain
VTALSRVTAALEGRGLRREGKNYQCPAHDDGKASLSVDRGEGGRVLLKCHAGCDIKDVVAALGLSMPDLFDGGQERKRRPAVKFSANGKTPATVAELAATKKLPPDYLLKQGCTDVAMPSPHVDVPWRGPGGDVIAVQSRPGPRGQRFAFRSGDSAPMYGSDKLDKVRAAGWVLLVEGATDCWTAWRHGIPALGLPSMSTWRDEWAAQLASVDVYWWQEDEAGARLTPKLAAAIPGLRVIAGAGHKDLSDAHVAGVDVKDLVSRLREAAPLAADLKPTETAAEPANAVLDRWLEPGPAWRLEAEQEKHPALIPGILPLGGLAALGGAKGIGKTWIATDLALSVANGVPFLGHYPVAVPGPVLVIQTEGSRRPAVARFDALARGKRLDPALAVRDIIFVWRQGLMLDVDDHLAWLRVTAYPYVLVIVDTLRDSHGGEENSNDVGARLARNLRSIANEGPTLVYAHHTSKAGPDTDKLPILERLRGNTALTGALDAVLLLERHRGATRTAVEVYCRDDRAEVPFTFAWPSERVDGTVPVTLDWKPGEESVSSALELVAAVLRVVEQEPGQSRRQVVDKLPHRHDLVVAAIEIAVKQDRLVVAETPYQDRKGRRRSRPGLYLAPFPEQRAQNGSAGEQTEPDAAIPNPSGTEDGIEYGSGAGNGENGENGALVTPDGEASPVRSRPLNREGAERAPGRQVDALAAQDPLLDTDLTPGSKSTPGGAAGMTAKITLSRLSGWHSLASAARVLLGPDGAESRTAAPGPLLAGAGASAIGRYMNSKGDGLMPCISRFVFGDGVGQGLVAGHLAAVLTAEVM